ncbi:MAG: PIN domain-containing protein [Candidatus Thorarchaeota archaeon]
MKILVDTTYFLPAISVEIEKLSRTILQALRADKNLDLFGCSITLFELAAKGAKLVKAGQLTHEDISIGLDAIRYDERIELLHWEDNPIIMELATEIRHVHSDFIDCLVLATAVCYTNTLITWDEVLLKKVQSNEWIKETILAKNEDFSFWLKDLTSKPVSIQQLEPSS